MGTAILRLAPGLSVFEALARLAVVVPVGPGDALAEALALQLASLPARAQVIVVCSSQAEVERIGRELAAQARPGWTIVPAPGGRASQQNAGAALASRPWLWFLHADSVLSSTALPALARLVASDAPALGYFDLQFLDDGPSLMRLTAAGAWLRSRWLQLPFGDQGLVLPRVLFERLGHFDTLLESGEDHELVWRVRRAGVPLRPLRAPLYTSARKYVVHGWGRTTLQHLGATWDQAWRFSRQHGAP